MDLGDYFLGYLVAMVGYEIGFNRTLRSYFKKQERP